MEFLSTFNVHMQTLQLSHIRTLAFAGGGNRCWWQAGLMTELMQNGAQLPALLVGTSAGAAAPPFMPGVRLHGEWAFDGGYTDNAPIPAQTATEKHPPWFC